MAENLATFQAGRALLELLRAQQPGLGNDVVDRITTLTAELLEEAAAAGGGAGGSTKAAAGKAAAQQQVQQQKQQQQVQQQQQPAATGARDPAGADALLPGLSFVSPRGKFDVGIFPDCMQLASKQATLDVPWDSIQHVLIIDAIPKQPGTTYVVLVMKSGKPVQHGKNQLDLVVAQTKDAPELCIAAPEACREVLGEQLTGAAAVVLSQLLASYIEDFSEGTFLTAEAGVFRSAAGDLMVAANKGVQAGWLVPLSAGLCYVGRGGCFMPRPAIASLQFHRTGGSSATFDVTIKLAAGAAAGAGAGGSRALELGQIDAAELPKLQAYCADQRIGMGAGDDDDDDDDHQAGGAATAAAAAAGGGGGGYGYAAAGPADDDDDDESDEDFDPEGGDDDDDGAAARPSKRRRQAGGGGGAGSSAQHAADEDEDDGSDDGDASEDDDESDDDDSEELVPSDELDAMDAAMNDDDDDGWA